MGGIVSEGGLGAHGVEIDEPGFEQRPRHGLQRLVHAAVQFDLVVQRAQDVGDGALIGEGWNCNFELSEVASSNPSDRYLTPNRVKMVQAQW